MTCPICASKANLLGTVAFDRNNAGIDIVDDTPMEYYKCTNCNFLYCPEMLAWTPEQLGERVYNQDYVKYDPDYTGLRPKNYAKFFMESFVGAFPSKITHLDYGSGSGIMSQELNKYNWKSTSYDPYSLAEKPTQKFDLITAIEVFEHSLDIDKTIKDILNYGKPTTAIVFSTQLVDKDTDIDWWYIGARNGHIGMLSEKSLKILAIKNRLYFSSLNTGVHVLQANKNNLKNIAGVIYGSKS